MYCLDCTAMMFDVLGIFLSLWFSMVNSFPKLPMRNRSSQRTNGSSISRRFTGSCCSKKLSEIELGSRFRQQIALRRGATASSERQDRLTLTRSLHSYVRFLSPAYRPVAAVVPEKAISWVHSMLSLSSLSGPGSLACLTNSFLLASLSVPFILHNRTACQTHLFKWSTLLDPNVVSRLTVMINKDNIVYFYPLA